MVQRHKWKCIGTDADGFKTWECQVCKMHIGSYTRPNNSRCWRGEDAPDKASGAVELEAFTGEKNE